MKHECRRKRWAVTVQGKQNAGEERERVGLSPAHLFGESATVSKFISNYVAVKCEAISRTSINTPAVPSPSLSPPSPPVLPRWANTT